MPFQWRNQFWQSLEEGIRKAMLGMCLISYLVSNLGPVFVHGRLSFELRNSGVSGGWVSLQSDIGIFRLPPVRPGGSVGLRVP